MMRFRGLCRGFIVLRLLSLRPHELKLHVRGAINNGVTKDEIKEVFIQTAIYCGVPAAIDSFRTAAGSARGNEQR